MYLIDQNEWKEIIQNKNKVQVTNELQRSVCRQEAADT